MSNISFSTQRRPGASPFKSPTAYHLRTLVLDYLSHKCYTNTAKAFINDSTVKALDADGDEIDMVPDPSTSSSAASATGHPDSGPLSEPPPHVLLKRVQQRREIRECILTGRVADAIDLLNKYFPSVLSDSLPHQNHDPNPTPPASAAPAAPSGAIAQTPPGGNTTGANNSSSFTYVSATSMEPIHLLLNLRILAFVESCRTRPLKIPSSSSAGSPLLLKHGNRRHEGDNRYHLSDINPADRMDTSDDDDDEDDEYVEVEGIDDVPVGYEAPSEITPERLGTLLAKGQKLYALASTLTDPKEKELYRKELENVGGLLAYTVPEESPVHKYMSYERREAVADQINRATLYRSGLSPISTIEVLTRYTTVLWQAARVHGVKVRTGAYLPPRTAGPPTPSPATRPDETVQELVPLFDLKQFLDARP